MSFFSIRIPMDICVGWLLDTRVSYCGYHYCFFIAQVTKKFSFGCYIKGPLLSFRQFLTIENPLKMIKNTFYFMLNALFHLEIFVLAFWLCRKMA